MLNSRLSYLIVFRSTFWKCINHELAGFFVHEPHYRGVMIFNYFNNARFFLPLVNGRRISWSRASLAFHFFNTKHIKARFLSLLAPLRIFSRSIVFGARGKVQVKGIGFRFDLLDVHTLRLSVGFSHFVILSLPQYSAFPVIVTEKGQTIEINSVNTVELRTIIARIVSFRYPNVYTGKGLIAVSFLSSLRSKPGKRIAS